MGDKPEGHKQEPTLELPSIRFPGRRRRKRAPEPADTPAEVQSGKPARTRTLPDAGPVRDNPPPVEAGHEQALRTAPQRRREPAGLSLPTVPAYLASAITGVLVGLVGAASTYAAMAGCEAVRGASTCGEGAGFFLLVAVLAVMVLVGSVLLQAFRVSNPASTSFLAVGMVAVIVLLLLLDMIFSSWMFLVVPVLGGASYTFSSWVTTRFADEGRTDYDR